MRNINSEEVKYSIYDYLVKFIDKYGVFDSEMYERSLIKGELIESVNKVLNKENRVKIGDGEAYKRIYEIMDEVLKKNKNLISIKEYVDSYGDFDFGL